jgi:hypothetical protein
MGTQTSMLLGKSTPAIVPKFTRDVKSPAD